MQCPRCKQDEELRPVLFEEEGVHADGHRCGRCDGHFFSRKNYGAITRVPSSTKVSFESIPDAHEQLYSLHCPACAAADPMIKGQAQREKRVTVDSCLQCAGIWLDGGELEAIRGEAASFFDAARTWFSGKT